MSELDPQLIPPLMTIKQAVIELPSHGGPDGVINDQCVSVRVANEGAGAYLVVSGENCLIADGDGDMKPHEFTIQTESDIEVLADSLMWLLKHATRFDQDAEETASDRSD